MKFKSNHFICARTFSLRNLIKLNIYNLYIFFFSLISIFFFFVRILLTWGQRSSCETYRKQWRSRTMICSRFSGITQGWGGFKIPFGFFHKYKSCMKMIKLLIYIIFKYNPPPPLKICVYATFWRGYIILWVKM